MVGTRSEFDPEPAPCGKTVGGMSYFDSNGEGFIAFDLHYACGCRRIRRDYHDGTVTTREIRHGRRGKVLHDEHPEHPV